MRVIFFILFFPIMTFSQKNFERSKIEVLESYETSYQNFWTGDKQSIKVSLVQETDSFKIKSFVNFEVFSKDYVRVGAASSVALSSAFDVAVSSTSISKIDRKRGVISLDQAEFFRLIDFFNEMIMKKASEKPVHETAWQLTVDKRFMVALIYRPDDNVKWFYCLSIDEAAFEVSTDEALALMQKLGVMKKILQQ
ncbi:MAG: hypothetical protein SFV22_02545 [Saprospiraceae bacterium]|nr:hypothetical protein [Saprospiraceae bacterium]